MTKVEKKLLQEREADLFLKKEQYRNWFGKDSKLAVRAAAEWMSVYEVLDLLDVDVDHNLPDNKAAHVLVEENKKLETQLVNQ